MTFRTRLVLALSLAMAATMGSAFAAVSIVMARSELHQLDDALRAEARGEAREVASHATGDELRLSGRPGPDDDGVQIAKYAAIYDEEGRVLDASPAFRAPPLAAIRHPNATPFDLTQGREHLRGVFVSVPGKPGVKLFATAPRSELEHDSAFLREVMAVAGLVALALIVLVTLPIVRGLTRDHDAIAAAVRRVAGGDLSARVALSSGARETMLLARDIDDMIARLSTLVESQQRFIANAAHELRSPLTALYGELQLALRRPRDADGYRVAIEEALDATVRLKSLADDLLALARLGAERERSATPVALAELAEHAAEPGMVEAKRRGVCVRIDADASVVAGHASDLERMLRNLIENAVRHSPDGGQVLVTARSAGARVELAVADEGGGVAPEDRERIFEPFFRGASERARGVGSGLGLAIVREIARAHGGDVTVEDAPTKGARFVAWLPTA